MALRRYVRSVVTVEADESVASAAQKLADAHVGCVVVVREGRPIGMLTDRDLVVRVLAQGRSATATRVSEIVTYDPFVVKESDGVDTALRTMCEHGVRRLPIVDDAGGKLVGIVTSDDLTVMLGRRFYQLAQSIDGNADSADTR